MDSDSYTDSSHCYAPTTIKGSPWLMLIYHFWFGPFSKGFFSSAQSWCLGAVWIFVSLIRNPMEYYSWGFAFWKHFELYLPIDSLSMRQFQFCLVCLFLFIFVCVTPYVFKGSCHVQSSGLVNIRCWSVTVFMLQLQRKSSLLEGLFILFSFGLVSTAWEF